MNVQMHGPAFDGSGELVDRLVPEVDVKAYEAAGYKSGPLPFIPKEPESEQLSAMAEPEHVKRRGRPPKIESTEPKSEGS